MSRKVIRLSDARLEKNARRAFRNWESEFGEPFGLDTTLGQISAKTLALLAEGRNKSTFYLLDLIMNLQGMGSGFDFGGRSPKEQIAIMDRHLFLLDLIRYEYMKRLGWLESYPGEESTLVELVINFEKLAPGLKADTPALDPNHPAYGVFRSASILEKEELIRKLIPRALEKIQDSSSTL
ncbi:MAG: hypothetical protein JRH06_05685 [Deltaproteobacteria bacterium]|nr:hypothetical protein [Deltaproteobacteria bacterium]MBW2137027.1 hypothetical protein [Deltaproteobacteria bacterium]